MSNIKQKLLKGFTLNCTELKQVFILYNQGKLTRDEYRAIMNKNQANHKKDTDLYKEAKKVFNGN